jgi:hypothetical protein
MSVSLKGEGRTEGPVAGQAIWSPVGSISFDRSPNSDSPATELLKFRLFALCRIHGRHHHHNQLRRTTLAFEAAIGNLHACRLQKRMV